MRRGIFRRSRPGWWIALGAAMVAAVCAPRVWRSRFVTQRRAARELDQARASVASRDFDRARVRFRAALRLEPFPASWRLLIRTTARSRGMDAATEAARRATQSVGNDAGLLQAVTDPGPEPAQPRRLRADAQIDFGTVGAWMREHWPGRLAQQREALEQQLAQRNWAEAERVVESARRAWPDTEFPPFLAGILALARDDDVGAEKQLSEALAMAPRFPTFLAALARTW